MKNVLTPARNLAKHTLPTLLLCASVLCAPLGALAQVTVVDVANDTTDPSNLTDGEPSIAVNPINPLEIAIVSFSESFGTGALAPIWKSSDGGQTWRKVMQIPEPAANHTGPYDQRIAYDAAGHLLVAEVGYDEIVGQYFDFVYRQTSADPDAPLTPGGSYGYDQPQLEVDKSATSAFLNRVYSAWANNLINPNRSTVMNSPDFGVTPTSVGAGDNSTFPNRTARMAVDPGGRAYIIYKAREGAVDADFENVHFRVNRSDDGGATWNAAGGAAGVSVHGASTVQTFFTNNFGNPAKGKVGRARSSDAWLAADPGDGDIYAAYIHHDASGFGQIFVARSTTQGTTWQTPVRVSDGTHHSAYPEIAVAANGAVGVLYLDYDDSGAHNVFRKHFARSFDDGAAWNDEIIQSFDPEPFANASSGAMWSDYNGLTAVGHTFYGVFTGAGIGRATPQLDPIFFRASAAAESSDFYVRDWTDTAASHDAGQEPSTNPVFYETSDVWNRRVNTPGTFTSDRPEHQDPREAGAGSNFAFVRVSRKAAAAAGSPPLTVNASFMFADFGIGTNYSLVGSAAPEPLTFNPLETAKTLASGHEWQLPVAHSDHVCMAVEINSPADPMMPVTLVGRAPGWPTTDLSVLDDNNKAQRNMAVYYGMGEMMYYALAHNAATERRDLVLRADTTPEAARQLRGASIEIIGGEKVPFKAGETIRLSGMEPGESRMLRLSLSLPDSRDAGLLPVSFSEIVSGKAINGFTIAPLPSPLGRVYRANNEFQRAVFARMEAAFNTEGAQEVSRLSDEILRQEIACGGICLWDGVQGLSRRIEKVVKKLVKSQPHGFAFSPLNELQAYLAAARSNDFKRAVAAQSNLLHTLDAYMTLRQLEQGNPADILQNVAWQRDLYRKLPRLRNLSLSASLLQRSEQFINDYRQLRAGNDKYPDLMRASMNSFAETARELKSSVPGLAGDVAAIQENMNSPVALQKAHWNFLLKVSRAAQ